MKYQFLTLTFLLALALGGVAQQKKDARRGSTPYYPLVQEGNNRQQWNVVYMASMNYPNDYFTNEQFIQGDITLDGVDYRIVWTRTIYNTSISGVVREEGQRVFFRRWLGQSYDREVLLYDFNLTVGDTITISWGETPLIVIEDSETEVNGTMRRQLGLGLYFGENVSRQADEYWIEGVGSTYGFLNSGYEGWTGAFVHLLCYHEDDEVLWMNEDFSSCTMNSDTGHIPFAPQGAEWYFNRSSFMGSPVSYYRMAVEGDTVIQGRLCSIITQPYLGGNGDKQYVYEDNRVVYWYNQTLQQFTVLYAFRANAGESWTCQIDSCSYEIRVKSVEVVNWNGHRYRVQNVVSDSDEYGHQPFYGAIIEGIGYEKGLFPYPWACSSSIYCGSYTDYLRCYLVDGEMRYHGGDYDCEEKGYCWDGTVAESYAGGDGTAENPYLIKTSKQLALLAQQTNNGTGGDAYYKLCEGINLKDCNGGIQQWVSIGTPEHPFTGHFDGGGKNILNLNQTVTDGNAQPVCGLFGCTNKAEISNVSLVQCYVHGSAKYAGGLVGYAGLTNISNCSIYDGCAETDNGVAGGLVGFAGYTYGVQEMSGSVYTIADCSVREAVKVRGSACAGGIVGLIGNIYNKAFYIISNCSMLGTADYFYVQGGSTAGGIVGQMWYGEVRGCTNHQKVVGGHSQGGGCVGGIIGSLVYSSCVEGCINYETGQISSAENYRGVHVGGIIGCIHSSVESNIRDCQNFSDLSGTGGCGGIVGFYFLNFDHTPSFIQYCNNHSKVTCHRPANAIGIESAGGIVGHVGQCIGNLCIVECSNFGDVVMDSEEQGDAGGILGSKENGSVYIVNVFNRGSVSAPIYAGGILGGGENIGNCVIQNVYNAGEVITGQEIKGGIAYNRQETDHFSECYWLGVLDNHAGVSEGEPLQHSCAFWPTTCHGEWSLDSLQFGHDLVQALNTGAEALVEQYPMTLGVVHRWEYDVDNINDGYPVFSDVEVGCPFVGTEWYYEILNDDGSVTYQHLVCAADTTVNNKDVKVIIRTNTLYDKHSVVTHEYIYEEFGKVYWWNKTLEEFTVLYDYAAETGDEWTIAVGNESVVMHVDTVEQYEYEGRMFKMLQVSDENGLFSGNIMCGIGHLTSFFPEKLMTRGKNYRVEGIRCYWRNGELVFKQGDCDCDEVYEQIHNGLNEMDNAAFAVYPNPTDGVLFVRTHAVRPYEEYRITNLMGQTVLSGSLNAETQQIDVSNLPQGMYFITFADETRKFVVR